MSTKGQNNMKNKNFMLIFEIDYIDCIVVILSENLVSNEAGNIVSLAVNKGTLNLIFKCFS